MSLFSFIFRPNKKKTEEVQSSAAHYDLLTAYQPMFSSWNGSIYEEALIRSVIDARARHISKLKVELMGTAEPKLRTRLKQAPNGFQTWSQFLYRTSTILDMHNTAFIVPVEDRYKVTVGYAVVLPLNAEIFEGPATEKNAAGQYITSSGEGREAWLKYTFQNHVGIVEMKRCCILTRHQYRHDFFGTDNRALAPVMDLITIQNQAIKEAVKSSASYRFMARVNNFTKPEDLAKERQRFTRENLDGGSGGGLLLFPNTYTDIRQISTNPYTVDESQMNQIRTNVYNYFGVNEDVLQNKAVGDAWSAYYEGAIEPFAVQFSETMTRAIFTNTQISNGNMVMATANRLQYMTNADKLNVSSQMADRGIMSRNEIREIWNLEPIDGGDVPTIRGEYYLLNPDGTTARHADDITGGTGNAG